MRFDHVRIEHLAIHEAPDRVTSAALEDDLADVYARLGIPANCMAMLTGIQARRFWPEGVEVAQAGTEAARRVLTDVDPDTLGAIISTSVSKEYLEPSVAALVHGDLGLPGHVANFDVSNACLGFLTGMKLAAQFIESGQMKRVLVVASESSRNVVRSTIARLGKDAKSQEDYKQNLPTLTLGSGAVAMVLARDDLTDSPHKFVGVVEKAATQHNRICMGTYEWMTTDATTLLKAGVALAKEVYVEAQREFGWSGDNIGTYACHQVGAAHLAAVARTLEFPIEKAILTYPEYGNMGSAALPFTLEKAREQGALTAGERVALMGIGSGLNCAMAEVVW